MSDIIIGSGPAGIATALARLERGRKITILDVGHDLEPDAEARRVAMAANQAGLSDQDKAEWMRRQFKTLPGQARRYGSDFAMQPADDVFEGGDPIALRSSHAAGGLSNLWGGAVLPWRQQDIDDWPITTHDLAPHWLAVAKILPVAGRVDALQPLFPDFDMTGKTALQSGPQIEMLLAQLARSAGRLRLLGAHAGQARQAVKAPCHMCGLCLHGCPWQLIWSARHSLSELRQNPAVTYRSGLIARAVSETTRGVRVDMSDGTSVEGRRVFVAAGVLETARILMASPGGPVEMRLKDSQFAFLPMLHRWRGPKRPDISPLHTLPQAFVEIDDKAVSPRLVHAQIYGWNEFYARDLRANYGARLGPAAGLIGPVLDMLARRLIVAQVFLHSDHSHSIALRRAENGRLMPTVVRNPATAGTMELALRRISEVTRLGGAYALGRAARLAAAGASFHCGSTLPMRKTPGIGESDTLGRPSGAGRIHVVDASVLPSIPATTITFGVMANAHRIARATADD